MKQRKVSTMLAAGALAAVVGIGGIMAYFTDGDTATNVFTVGKISMELSEPGWVPEEGEDITPGKTVEKDPTITNNGENNEFVFVEVIVPYAANIVTANDDGTVNAAADTQLYTYTVNSGWVQVGEVKKDTSAKTNTYVYAYAASSSKLTELAKDASTPAVFDSVTFANIVEDQGLETTNQNIVINAYGIQTTDLNGGKTDPASVWAIIQNQLPSLEKN